MCVACSSLLGTSKYLIRSLSVLLEWHVSIHDVILVLPQLPEPIRFHAVAYSYSSSVLYYEFIICLISPHSRLILLIKFDKLFRVVGGEGLPSIFMELLRNIIGILFLRWMVNILGALFNWWVANHVPLIGKEGKHTLLFHILVRNFIQGNLRSLAQVVIDPENVWVRSVCANLLALKHISRRVGLRKEMFHIQIIRSISPREVGGQSLVGQITRLFFVFWGMCQHTVGLIRKDIRLLNIFFCRCLHFGFVSWRVIEFLNVNKCWIYTGQYHLGLSNRTRSLSPRFLNNIFRTL